MKCLILILSLLSAWVVAEDFNIPPHMLSQSMAQVERKADVVADVTIDDSRDNYVLNYIGRHGAFSETYRLHEATMTTIYKGHDTEGYGQQRPVELTEKILIRQWGSGNNQYKGVPVLKAGHEYRLWLTSTHFTDKDTGFRIFVVVGQNGGMFNLSNGEAVRDANNTSSIDLTNSTVRNYHLDN